MPSAARLTGVSPAKQPPAPAKDALPPWSILGAGSTSKDNEQEALKTAK